MEIGPDRAPGAAALVAAVAVVPEPGDHPPERLCILVEDRPPGVVLEAGERPRRSGLELALEEHVADHPPRPGYGVERQQADARQLLAALVAVEMAEQLIAAADGQERRPRLEGLVERGPECGELGRDQRLLTILTTAHVEQVVFSALDLSACAEWPHLQLVAPPGGPRAQDGDVAAVGIDVEVVREQVTDDEAPHAGNRTSRRGLRRRLESGRTVFFEARLF